MSPSAKTYTILCMKKFFLTAFIISFIVYFFTSAGKTPYDYFTRLSDSFLAGKIYLQENPPWLNELIPAGVKKYYVPYPPMPAIVAIPFRLFFKENFHQEYLSQILGAGIVALTMAVSWAIKKNKKLLIWTGLLTAFGNIIWFLSATGSSWYLGQVTAAFFLTAGILESITRKRPIVVGLMLGTAYLARLQVILSLPLFLYFLFDKRKWIRNFFEFALGVLPFVTFDFYYNFVRFGTIFDKGYYLIPGVLNEPWNKNGLFNPANILNHLKVIFGALPNFRNTTPFVTPSWWGLAIWITTPAFIYSLWANIKEGVTRYSWLSIALISFVIFSHGTTGFAQFGYRFAVDFYPILIFLVIKGVASTGVKWHHWLLLALSIIVNLWGVLWINKFGWISY